jgi:hypothetical protein
MYRKQPLLTMLIMSLFVFAGAQAQAADQSFDYCTLLSAPDCEILNNNEAAMADVHSFALDLSMTMDMSVTDPSTEVDESLNLVVDGEMSLSIDPEVLSGLKDMEGMEAIDTATVTTMLDSLLTGIEGELSLTLITTTADETIEIPLNLLMEDGVYAFDLASLSASSGESPQGMEGMEWLGINLTGAVESMMEDPEFASMFDVETMSGMMGMNYNDLAEAMTISRLPDSEVNGVAVAVFDILIDYAKLLEIVDMTDTLATTYSGMGMEQTQIEAAIAMLGNIEIPVREYIGLEDFYTYRIEVSMDMETDLAMDIKTNDAATSDLPLGAVTISLTMNMDMSDFNKPVDVEIPTDAMILPYSMLMQMSGS